MSDLDRLWELTQTYDTALADWWTALEAATEKYPIGDVIDHTGMSNAEIKLELRRLVREREKYAPIKKRLEAAAGRTVDRELDRDIDDAMQGTVAVDGFSSAELIPGPRLDL